MERMNDGPNFSPDREGQENSPTQLCSTLSLISGVAMSARHKQREEFTIGLSRGMKLSYINPLCSTEL